ncbi:hypothetical protein NK8_68440 (plasmid) [Caballeronia sp. NK8]|nr:hypothetical protein NK8_68440 [Caballeronia sp. NK8]
MSRGSVCATSPVEYRFLARRRPESVEQSAALKLLMFARATHRYAGCIFVVKAHPTDANRASAVVVEMSDGIGVYGTCVRLQDGTLKLSVESWITAQGSAVEATNWVLRCVDEERSVWKVVKP